MILVVWVVVLEVLEVVLEALEVVLEALEVVLEALEVVLETLEVVLLVPEVVPRVRKINNDFQCSRRVSPSMSTIRYPVQATKFSGYFTASSVICDHACCV